MTLTLKIYLPRTVRGDFPIGHHLVAEAGVHDAVANQHGAVSVVLADGSLLGVKPDEYLRPDAIVCPSCFAARGVRCLEKIKDGSKFVDYYHQERIDAAKG